ncbi:MAG: IclR family transcriptional regulator [Solirubrobacteraceae bacterium]
MRRGPTQQRGAPQQRATSLLRGTDILIALGSDEALERDGLGVVRIAELIGTEKSQASRALSALAATGLVDRDPDTRAYRLGWRLFTLAARSGRPRLVAHAPTVLRGLVAATGETAHLSVLQGAQVLTLLSETPSSAISARGWSGRTVPVVCTSSGRALLFDHDRAALDALLSPADFEGYGPAAPGDLDELARRIAAARERGFASVDGEFEPGLVGLAAPVCDGSRRIVAAINISGPKFRLGRALPAAARALRLAADQLGAAAFGAPPVQPVKAAG